MKTLRVSFSYHMLSIDSLVFFWFYYYCPGRIEIWYLSVCTLSAFAVTCKCTCKKMVNWNYMYLQIDGLRQCGISSFVKLLLVYLKQKWSSLFYIFRAIQYLEIHVISFTLARHRLFNSSFATSVLFSPFVRVITIRVCQLFIFSNISFSDDKWPVCSVWRLDESSYTVGSFFRTVICKDNQLPFSSTVNTTTLKHGSHTS